MEGLKQLLERPLSELVRPHQRPVLLPHNVSIGEALKVLARHAILSAPIVMYPDLEEVGSSEGVSLSPQLLGWVDVGDILRGLLVFLGDIGPGHMLALLSLLEEKGTEYADKMLITVRGEEDSALIYQAEAASTSVLSAVRELFQRTTIDGEARAVHRIALFDAHGDITAIVSQMDVARWLAEHGGELGRFADQSLEQLGMLTGKPPVVQVNPHSPALVAFGAMAAAQVSGAPVVTDAGELIANLSISDLRQVRARTPPRLPHRVVTHCLADTLHGPRPCCRLITPEHFGSLALPVAEYLALAHGTTYLGYSAGASAHARLPFFASSSRAGGAQRGDIQLHTVRRDSSLRQVLARMVEQHIHRVYVVTPSARGVDAVITLTDVLRLVADAV
jgi:5'-AMP-activated protein kinase regulatory gamma subunit